MHNTFKFAHLGDPLFGRRTIGYRINDTDNTVDFAVAQCRTNDQFCKATGRKIVEGRILKGGNHANTGLPRSYSINLADIKNGSTKYRDIIAYIDANF
jgi:hypothetical protein